MFYICSWDSLCESCVNNQVKKSIGYIGKSYIGKCTIYSKISDQKLDYFTPNPFQKKKKKEKKILQISLVFLIEYLKSLICSANLLTGFYMMATLAFNEFSA